MIYKVIVGLMYMPFAFWCRGKLLQLLWEWFVTPVTQVDPPSFGICMGLSLLLVFIFQALQVQVSRIKKEKENSIGEIIATDIGINLMTWGIAAFFHFWC